jgi:hypothetical protein
MLLYYLVAETGLMVAAAACVTAILMQFWYGGETVGAVIGISLGAIVGASVFALLAPRIDASLGRGRLLSTAYVASAAGPLLVAGFLSNNDPAFLAAAAALFGFAASVAPQRFAIAFDLCPSRTRLRSSLDLHAIRFVAGSGGVLLVVYGRELFEPLGLLVASAFGVMALTTFVLTLGSLGRPRL